MIYRGKNNEYISLQDISGDINIVFDTRLDSPLIIVWTKDENTVIEFEGEILNLSKNTIICLTKFYDLKFVSLTDASLIKFNREFYCVLYHDKEVSCKGVLFFGANQLPYFQIPENELETFETVWKMFELEMKTEDEMQLEMLQTMLKRFLILCTRIYKNINQLSRLQIEESNILREFNYLVEQNFREKRTVQEYADLLNKSPKTLSNLFSKISEKSPLQIIHERITIEARRLLRYTDKSIKEITYDLNFEDIQTFSRFFKKMEKISPSDFKKTL
jgi:AraC-like DNA-binding protein